MRILLKTMSYDGEVQVCGIFVWRVIQNRPKKRKSVAVSIYKTKT